MQPLGTYVTFGPKRPPEVHMLGFSQDQIYSERLRLARDSERMRHDAYRVTFGGSGIECALPAWSPECMAQVAQHYKGPHEIQLRGLCAAIALGKPYGPDADNKGEDPKDGGTKVPRKPIKPRSPAPAKATAWSSL